jgi:ABC-type transporter Mla subunit MlaD
MIWRFPLLYDEKFKNLQVKIGILVFIVLFATVISLLYVGYKKDLFAHRISYRIISPTGEKLFKGMPVKLEGFRMGEVSSLDLNDEGKIVLTVDILKKYQKWIRKDSEVFLSQESIIGNAFLKFTSGSPDKPVMPENSVFTLKFEGGIDEIISRAKPVMENLKQIVENLKTISDRLSSPEGDFQKFMASLRRTGEQLEKGDGAVPYLLRNRESKDKVDSILGKLSELGDTYDTLGHDLDKSSAKLDSILGEIDSTLKLKVSPILDDIAQSTKDLYLLKREGEYTLRLSSDLLLKLNNTWPFTPSEKEKKTPELPLP